MTITLPASFRQKMQALLQEEYESFIESFTTPAKWQGLRVNTLKLEADRFQEISPFHISPIPWCKEGFYYHENERPGKHPYYHAGLYYIQEPSAMIPVEMLNIQPGEKVLDLCAAPGGKSTQIAAKLQGEGVLLCNEPHPDRAKALAKNIEMAGIRNAIVCNEQPERLVQRFAGYFDKILVDAPCSGEGMFRKDEDMAGFWTEEKVTEYADLQRTILESASRMLRPGGRMVYSTCTFSPEENEQTIADFLSQAADFHTVKLDPTDGLQPGRPSWVKHMPKELATAVSDTLRSWPHFAKGEGHYIAAIERADHAVIYETDFSGQAGKEKQRGKWRLEELDKEQHRAIKTFYDEFLHVPLPHHLIVYRDFIYAIVMESERLQGLKLLRPGWFLGEWKRRRFVPSHALAMGITPNEAKTSIQFQSDDEKVVRYLKGETLDLTDHPVVRLSNNEPKGYTLVCVDGFSLGWGKWNQGMLKNEYPPGWRWM